MRQQRDNYQWLMVLVVLILTGIGATLWYMRQPSGQATKIEIATPSAKAMATSNAPRLVKVYVTGAVVNPGVYSLPTSARVEDVVAEAGGFANEAARDEINLAAPISDGQHVHIPSANGSTSSSIDSSKNGTLSSAKLDINTASSADLEKLPRIGSAIAARIVSYRASHGPFTSIEQLRDLKIVRESDFEQIKDLIAVN